MLEIATNAWYTNFSGGAGKIPEGAAPPGRSLAASLYSNYQLVKTKETGSMVRLVTVCSVICFFKNKEIPNFQCDDLPLKHVSRVSIQAPAIHISSALAIQLLTAPLVEGPCTNMLLTHWSRDKMGAISQMTLSNAFLQWKCLNFD